MKRLKIWILLIATFLAGITFGIFFINLFAPAEHKHIISIFSILINILIATVIGLIITKKYSDDRGVKDYFIQEVKDIIVDYKFFRNKLFNQDLSSEIILAWSKEISGKIQHLEYFLKVEFEIEGISLMKQHRELHAEITSNEMFNESFSNPKFKPSSELKIAVSEKLKHIKYALIKKTVKINRS